MLDCFAVRHLDVDRLLTEWRWLCPHPMRLVARNVFGDLFLADESGAILKLDMATGQIATVAESESEFQRLAGSPRARSEWFAEADERASEARGLAPGKSQCVAFSVPLALAKPGVPNKPYVADIYECVSFLGNLHRQIADLPDGAQIQFKITD